MGFFHGLGVESDRPNVDPSLTTRKTRFSQ